MGANRWRVLAGTARLRIAVLLLGSVLPALSYAQAQPRLDGVTSSYSLGRTRINAPAANGYWIPQVNGSTFRVGTTGPVAAPGGKSANVENYKVIPKTGAGGAGRHMAKALKLLPFIGTGLVLWEFWDDYGVRPDGNGDLEHDPGTPTTLLQQPCWKVTGQTTCHGDHGGAAAAYYGPPGLCGASAVCEHRVKEEVSATAVRYEFRTKVGASQPCWDATGGHPACLGASGWRGITTVQNSPTNQPGCTNGQMPRPDGKCPTLAYQPISENAADALLATVPTASLAPALDAALDELPMPLEAPVPVAQPIPDVPGPTTTTTGPDGITTTETAYVGEPVEDGIEWEEVTETTNPDGSTETTEKPPEQKDPCELNPARVGCMEAGTPDDAVVTNTDINVAISPVSFGATTATCPANAPIVTSFGTYAFQYDGMCTFATGIRPVVIAMAWLAAGFILLGMRSAED